MPEAFVSWSGGKDCCYAYHRAVSNNFKVRYLLNMVTEDAKVSRSHGLSADLLRVQGEAMGIPLVQQRTTHSAYKDEFIKALIAFRKEGITTGIFGDIDFNEHREWIENVCTAGGMTPIFPLWQSDQEQLISEFIDLGYESIVVAIKANLFGEEWLGRRVDSNFISDLRELGKTKTVTPCGEAGEYHTYVIDGPLFGKRIEIKESGKDLKGEHWFLRIHRYELKSKCESPEEKA